jgi:uncharacterized protein YeeX (DUF496 family)
VTDVLNKDVFVNDPSERNLPNDGVAKVRPLRNIMTGDDAEVLRHELQTFVCEGHYKDGLSQILDSYLGNLSATTQRAVWVSGFFGSGKSHFVRVLEALWRNVSLGPDGPNARDITTLSQEIHDRLRDLDKDAEREGGLWSASGMVTENREQSIRLTLLGIIFTSAGLPSDYGRAKFQLWLRRNGWEEAVKRVLQERGKQFEQEIGDYLASTELANAILAVTPDLGSTPSAILDRLESSFPAVNDVGDDQFVRDVRTVLELVSSDGKRLPLTLIVLDEMQQYIAEDTDRSENVQRVVETLQSEFESRILVVATGQASLNDTAFLEKLKGRFTISVMLQDTDVESVVRKVVLEKTSVGRAAVQKVIDGSIGEINRHLQGSDIGPRPEDRDDLAADYPLLPSRRRFWEQVLRKTDRSGTAGQLRNQLRVVHQATRAIANHPLGNLIPGDMIFHQMRDGLVQTGFLMREINQFISDQEDGTTEGSLRSRLVGLIFLINSLKQDENIGITGLRLDATADTLADLLVEDLTVPSHELRNRIPGLLQGLVDDGKLALSPEGHYAIQTGESLRWHEQFVAQERGVRPDRVAEVRTRILRDKITEQLKSLVRTQGKSKEGREYSLHFGSEAPEIATNSVPIWVRDEFGSVRSTVVEDARNLGIESPIILVFVPVGSRRVELNDAIRRSIAAEATLNWGGSGSTQAKLDAQANMRTVKVRNESIRDGVIEDMLREAIVLQGGGNEINESTLRDRIQEAFSRSLGRLYSRFDEADHTGWPKVFELAVAGNGEALERVDYAGEPVNHVVCKTIAAYIGGEPGKSWSEVRLHFKAAPYGWGNDAIDGALMALTGAHAIRATRNGKDAKLDELRNRQQLAQVRFIGEQITITTGEYLKLRSLFTALGFNAKDDAAVHAQVAAVVARLREAMKATGGEEPLPLPIVPGWLTELESLGGNQLLKTTAGYADEIKSAYAGWVDTAETIAARLPAWHRLQQFTDHARGLSGVDEIVTEIEAIRSGRLLLAVPDPVPDLRHRVTTLLRDRMTELRQRYQDRFLAEEATFHASENWSKLRELDRQKVVAESKIGQVHFPSIAGDDQLISALSTQSIESLENLIEALPQRFSHANSTAAKLLEPTTVVVSLTKPHLKTEADVDQWIRKTKDSLLTHIRNGNPVTIQ